MHKPTLHSHTHCQAALANAKTQAWQRVCLSNRTVEKRNNEGTTSCIVHLANSANIQGVTSNKPCSGLTGLCFESPNDTIHVTVSILFVSALSFNGKQIALRLENRIYLMQLGNI